MKRILLILGTLVSYSSSASAQIELPDVHEHTIDLNESIEGFGLQFFVYSMNNENTEYWLTAVGPPEQSWRSHTLIYGDRLTTASSYGADWMHSTCSFALDPEYATQIAERLGIPRQDRVPLDEDLEFRFDTPGTVQVGEDVTVEMVVTNRGEQPIQMSTGGAYRGSGRNDRFSFRVLREGENLPDIGGGLNLGGITGIPVLGTDQSASDSANLAQWASLEPGEYVVHVEFHLELELPSDAVAPEQYAVAAQRWDRHVLGRFTLTVEP